MKIYEIKEQMINYRDFYGGDLLEVSEVQKAKTRKELYDILERHRSHMESMLADANSHLDNFKKKLGLYLL